jgi:hypothetical protein
MDVIDLWNECSRKKLGQVAQENNLSKQQLVAMFDQSGLTGRRPADPGPNEIAAVAASIRQEWTPEVEAARWIAARSLNGIV